MPAHRGIMSANIIQLLFSHRAGHQVGPSLVSYKVSKTHRDFIPLRGLFCEQALKSSKRTGGQPEKSHDQTSLEEIAY